MNALIEIDGSPGYLTRAGLFGSLYGALCASTLLKRLGKLVRRAGRLHV